MTRKTSIILKTATCALAILAYSPAHAEGSGFGALVGVAAEPLNVTEMEETQGRSIVSGFDPFTGRIETCVLGGLSCSGSSLWTPVVPGPTIGAGAPFSLLSFPDPYRQTITGTEVADILASWLPSYAFGW